MTVFLDNANRLAATKYITNQTILVSIQVLNCCFQLVYHSSQVAVPLDVMAAMTYGLSPGQYFTTAFFFFGRRSTLDVYLS